MQDAHVSNTVGSNILPPAAGPVRVPGFRRPAGWFTAHADERMVCPCVSCFVRSQNRTLIEAGQYKELNPRKRRPGSVSAGGYYCVQAVANHLADALLRVAAHVDRSNREVIG